MANKSFFNFSKPNKSPSTALNAAQAPAYDLGPKGILAQLVSTGTISDSFYSKANDQFKMFLENANQV
ncbi:MAG: RNA-binding protein, partial [Proteobacteria bacterium]